MKNIKRILLTSLICVFSISLFVFSTKNVNATKSDNGKGNWTPTETITQSVLGMEHLSVYGNANDTKPQHINVLSMKTDGYSSKLVTWSVTSGNNKYTRQTLDVIAKDYEEKHPGWIVVGGINADQYTTGYGSDIGAGSAYFTPQTYYPLIMDGESRIPYTVLNSYGNHVGFANDGSSDSLVAASPVIGFVLHSIDENGQILATYNVDKINETPGVNETTVWSTYISKSTSGVYQTRNIKSSNNIYVITNPELAYMNNCVEYGGVNSMFGRGIISEVVNEKVLVSNQFAIDSSNEDVINALQVGTRVVVEAKYQDERLNKVEASTGYHSVHRYNDEDQALVHTDYDGNRYSRAIVGKKADGTYVLLTVDVATDPNDLTVRYAGMGFDECNATLKHYGVVEAYQMDGGGSVTSILRNAEGGFDITNYPRDGVRANMTGLLYVVRKPNVDVKADYHSVTVDTVYEPVNQMPSYIDSFKVEFNGKTYEQDGEKIVITGLEEDTTYSMNLIYNVVENKLYFEDVVGRPIPSVQYIMPISFKTSKYQGIEPTFEVVNLGKTSFTVRNNNHGEIQNVVVSIDSYEYPMNESSINITDLIGDTEYEINISYELYDEVSKNTYKRNYETFIVKTTNYEIPTIDEFEISRQTDNRLVFKYKYTDIDGAVTGAYIYLNDEKHELPTKNGLYTFNDLDLNSNLYTVKIVLEYAVEGTNKTVESSTISAGSQDAPKKYTITYNLDGGNIYGEPEEYIESITLEDIPEPTKSSCEFAYWLVNGEKVDEYKELTGNLELTAVWNTVGDIDDDSSSGSSCNIGASIKYLISLTAVLGLLVVALRKQK